ncbi:MAG: cytochrome c oxidase subunit 3 [Chlamydiia bacterium]|nr:cytochrome c oxidase subunit 3 [Chlamydiia bacterium]
MKAHEAYPDSHHDIYSKTVFGFWLYLLTDFMLFATIFAAYAVLGGNTFGGPTQKDLFDLDYTTLQTFILLFSTFTISVGGVYAHRKSKGGVLTFFLLTFILGFFFLGMECHELSHIVAAGSGWKENAFASSFFTLIGMFLLHVIFALLWIIVLLIPVFSQGLSAISIRRLTCLKMFWQFLNIVWMFIYTIVYLLGIV